MQPAVVSDTEAGAGGEVARQAGLPFWDWVNGVAASWSPWFWLGRLGGPGFDMAVPVSGDSASRLSMAGACSSNLENVRTCGPLARRDRLGSGLLWERGRVLSWGQVACSVPAALVGQGRRDQAAQTGWLQQQKPVPHSSGGWQSEVKVLAAWSPKASLLGCRRRLPLRVVLLWAVTLLSLPVSQPPLHMRTPARLGEGPR